MQQRVHRSTVTGVPYHDVEGARAAIGAWVFPRTWLDFETIGFALPRWVGMRPYAQAPFQFSAHVEAADGHIEHREFLSLDGSDPRRGCAEALRALIPDEGAIIAYNAPFERGCIRDLAAAFPDLAEVLDRLNDRLVNLLPVTRNHWYHRDQRGSWSIKAVLPRISTMARWLCRMACKPSKPISKPLTRNAVRSVGKPLMRGCASIADATPRQ